MTNEAITNEIWDARMDGDMVIAGLIQVRSKISTSKIICCGRGRRNGPRQER
jgi:hypothetical protein